MTYNNFFLIKYALDIYDPCIPQYPVMYLYYFDTQACPTRPFTMACLWPVILMDLYSNQGQVQHYMDIFWASLVQTFSPMLLRTLPSPTMQLGTWVTMHNSERTHYAQDIRNLSLGPDIWRSHLGLMKTYHTMARVTLCCIFG
jgi:hypothetical protein